MDTQRAVANDHIVRQLEEARQRTRWLLSTVSDEDLSRQHDPIMSPLVWGYGHIGNYEELWLLEKAFGKRLPTEEEWEKAASWDPETGTKRLYPWGGEPPTPGTANLGQTAFGPAGTGAYPAGTSAYGILGIIGDIWEWTASDFAPFPLRELPLQRVLRNLLRPHLQGAARGLLGHPSPRHPQHLPQLGLPDPAPAIRGISLCEVGIRLNSLR